MKAWRLDEGPLPLKEAVSHTISIAASEQDRRLLEGLGLEFNESGTECTFPAGKGIMSLPSEITDETYNEEHTRIVAHTLERFFQVSDIRVCVSTRFTIPGEGAVQPQWTTLSVLAQSAAAPAAPAKSES